MLYVLVCKSPFLRLFCASTEYARGSTKGLTAIPEGDVLEPSFPLGQRESNSVGQRLSLRNVLVSLISALG